MEGRRTTPIGEMWVEDGVIRHRIDRTDNITEEDARRVVEMVGELARARPMPAIVDMRAVGFATAKARNAFAGSPESSFESATALIVGNPTSQLMAKTFLKLSRPQRPIEVFTDERKALAWAQQHVSAGD